MPGQISRPIRLGTTNGTYDEVTLHEIGSGRTKRSRHLENLRG
ncbi:hypothetical protein [Streptomyces aurantiacus]|nr:hypothetical protein [Streptomyces aurantiacus]